MKVYRTKLSEVRKLMKEQRIPKQSIPEFDPLNPMEISDAMREGIQPLIDALKRKIVGNLKRYAKENHLEYDDVYTIMSEIDDDEPDLAITVLMDTGKEE
jgi:hypothetical protein